MTQDAATLTAPGTTSLKEAISIPLRWFSIIGAAVTIFGNFQALLDLADWARWIVAHWRAWTHAFWTLVFGWLKIDLHPGVVPILTATLFFFMIGIATLSPFRTPAASNLRRTRSLLGFLSMSFLLLALLAPHASVIAAWVGNSEPARWITGYSVTQWIVRVFQPVADWLRQNELYEPLSDAQKQIRLWAALLIVPTVLSMVLTAALYILRLRHTPFLWARAALQLSISALGLCLAIIVADLGYSAISITWFLSSLVVVPGYLLIMIGSERTARFRQLIFLSRLTLVAGVVLLLLALSELSRLGIDIKAPKITG